MQTTSSSQTDAATEATNVSFDYIEEKLGDYPEERRIWLVDEDSLYYFD